MADDTSAPALRRCLREPIPEIALAAKLLSEAVDAHLAGDRALAEGLIRAADMAEIRRWVAPLMGSERAYPERRGIVGFRPVANAPGVLAKSERQPVRMPNAAERAELLARDGFNCVFCGIPLVQARVRSALGKAFPDAAYWGTECHAALWCMWLQFDHVLPHSRGGDNSIHNVVVTCAGCNYGRMSLTLEEVGVIDPRQGHSKKSSWDGLERLFGKPNE